MTSGYHQAQYTQQHAGFRSTAAWLGLTVELLQRGSSLFSKRDDEDW